jgi:hypothetical protein
VLKGLISFSNLCLDFPSNVLSQVFQLRFCIHVIPLACLLRTALSHATYNICNRIDILKPLITKLSLLKMPVCTPWDHKRSGGIPPRILNLGAERTWVVSFTRLPLYPWWAPETLARGEDGRYILSLSGFEPRLPGLSACSPVAVVTELYPILPLCLGSVLFSDISKFYCISPFTFLRFV